MTRLLDHRLQFLAGMEGDDPAGADRDLLAGLRIAAGALRLIAELKVTESGELDALAALERSPDLLKKRLDHILGLALVQADLLEQEVGQLGLSQRHHLASSLVSLLCTESCREFAAQQGDQRIAGSVCLRIRKGSFSMLHNYPESKAFFARRELGAAIEAEQAHGAHNGRFFRLQGVNDGLDGGAGVEKQRYVAKHDRLVRRYPGAG